MLHHTAGKPATWKCWVLSENHKKSVGSTIKQFNSVYFLEKYLLEVAEK